MHKLPTARSVFVLDSSQHRKNHRHYLSAQAAQATCDACDPPTTPGSVILIAGATPVVFCKAHEYYSYIMLYHVMLY